MNSTQEVTDNNFDDPVDAEIQGCLDLNRPQSFFMFAGAGSGKTRSLVNAINAIRERDDGKQREFLALRAKFIGVITYTKAATNEINRRVLFDPVVRVSTIHSFAWELIRGFNDDIRSWLVTKLQDDIAQLQGEQSRARDSANKASIDRSKRINSKQRRLGTLAQVRRFNYNPDHEAEDRDSLAHSEVIGLAAHFLVEKPIMQEILIRRFPILLIDESQDTNAKLMDALIRVQVAHRNSFALGLFGDTMQRIYNDGKSDWNTGLPKDWKTPARKMNHRSPPCIVDLINKVRSTTDDKQTQRARTDKKEGFVRFFLLPGAGGDKIALEQEVARRMSRITADPKWTESGEPVKRLILEHHMATSRMGFTEMFTPLYGVEKMRTRLLDGSLSGIEFFGRYILPLVEAGQKGDEFGVAAVVRKYSPILHKRMLKNAGDRQAESLAKARAATAELLELCAAGNDPTFAEVLTAVARTTLFPIPDALSFYTSRTQEETAVIQEEAKSGGPESEEERSALLEATNAWEKFLQAKFSQLVPYLKYVRGEGGFGTHQGVKGLEFPRVLVIMDDAGARGWQFSYERLFGASAESRSGRPSEDPDKTKRLFYVTCSRATESLALVAYTAKPDAVTAHLLSQGWCKREEIIRIDSIES